jgi:subtilase family serine protease
MAVPDRRIETAETNRTLIIVVAVIAAVAIAGLFYGLMYLTSQGNTPPEVAMQGAIREGSPQFAELAKNIVLDEPEGTEAKRALGDIVMSLQTTVRNLTGKTLTGLEIRAAVLDYEGKPVKQRAVVVVPNRQQELAPNKTMQVNVSLDGFSETDARARLMMEVTAFKFKE